MDDDVKRFYHKETSFEWESGLNHSEAAELLYFIPLQKVGDFDEVFNDVSTQKNESFHEEQLCYENKNLVPSDRKYLETIWMLSRITKVFSLNSIYAKDFDFLNSVFKIKK